LDGVDAPPNDPYYHLQWWLPKISAPAAWDISRGDTAVVIAVVDVGVDIDHGDLLSRRWINTAEANGTPEVDDDGNGFIDDVYGWDFYADDPDPRPDHGDVHGTHVAGIAAAATDNSYGIAGVGWNCRIMAVRAGSGRTVSYGYEGVIYAAATGADIINMSWGSNTPSNIERITTEYAAETGALLVAAAGNRSGVGNPTHYPAGYNEVIAVASVGSEDIVSSFSKTGEWVDISAPGDSILSVAPGGGFAVLSGTSMATPMVAGGAGLLKALHPDWSPDQLRLQMILTADPIDGINPDYAGRIGHGRLNLYRALADIQAGFDLVSVEIDDRAEGNGDGVIDPGERLEVAVVILNLLTAPAEITGSLTSTGDLQIEPIRCDFGTVAPGARADNHGNPFRLRVSPFSASGSVDTCSLHLTGAGMPPADLPFTITTRPPYDQHDNGQITLTLTNFGALGYYDYVHRRNIGEGLRYPRGGLSSLFHGSLMIGASDGRVSDCAFGDSSMSQFDFISLETGFAVEEADGCQFSCARFFDDRAEHPLNVDVTQQAISFPDPPDDDYVLLSYTVRNCGRDAIDSMRIGLFLDWDIVYPLNNVCGWNADDKLGWTAHSSGAYPRFGVAMLEPEPGFYTVLRNRSEFGRGWWTDIAKLERMRSGFSHVEEFTPDDYSQLIGTGRFDIAAFDSVTATFVLLAGDDMDDLRANLAAARRKWAERAFERQPSRVVPEELTLVATFPMPFNDRLNLVVSSTAAGRVTWSVFDPLGRMVRSPRGLRPAPGSFTMTLRASDLPAGRYFIRLQRGGCRLTVPVTLIR